MPLETKCTESLEYPSLDVLGGISAGIGGGLLYLSEPQGNTPEERVSDREARTVLGAAMVLGGVVAIGAGIWGASKVSQCRQALKEEERAQASLKSRDDSFTHDDDIAGEDDDSFTNDDDTAGEEDDSFTYDDDTAGEEDDSFTHQDNGTTDESDYSFGSEYFDAEDSGKTSEGASSAPGDLAAQEYGPSRSPELVGTGTCFAASSNGTLVTNFHVIEGASALLVLFPGQEAIRATVIAVDPDKDIAILKIPRATPDFLPLTSATSLELAAPVFTIGFPRIDVMGGSPKFTEGSVSSMRTMVGWQLQISVPIQPGNSGGPLVDNRGFAVGITTAILTEMQNANIAVKADYAIPLLPKYQKRRALKSRRAAIKRTQGAICLVANFL